MNQIISKAERKAYNRHVRETRTKRREAANGIGVLAALFMAIAFMVPTDFAMYPFGIAVFFAFISWITSKIYADEK